MIIKGIKKGAMFGLDARIALAIFGALSVISGAALYSAVENAKAMALLTTFENLSKSIEAMYIDTGVYPPAYNYGDFGGQSMNMGSLVNSTAPGWRGPYTSLPIFATNPGKPYEVKHEGWLVNGFGKWSVRTIKEMNRIFLTSLTNGNWGDEDSDICIYLTGSSSVTAGIFEIMDQKVDGGDGPAKGKLQVYQLNNTYIPAKIATGSIGVIYKIFEKGTLN